MSAPPSRQSLRQRGLPPDFDMTPADRVLIEERVDLARDEQPIVQPERQASVDSLFPQDLFQQFVEAGGMHFAFPAAFAPLSQPVPPQFAAAYVEPMETEQEVADMHAAVKHIVDNGLDRALIKTIAKHRRTNSLQVSFWKELYEAKPSAVHIVDVISPLRDTSDMNTLLLAWKETLIISRDDLVDLVPYLQSHALVLTHYIRKQPLVHWPSADEINWLVRMAMGIDNVAMRISFLEVLVQECTVPIVPDAVHSLDAELLDAVFRLYPSPDRVLERPHYSAIEAFLNNWGRVNLEGRLLIPDGMRARECYRNTMKMCMEHNLREKDRVMRTQNAAAKQVMPEDRPTNEETKQCTMCWTNEKKLVFVPCGHHYACVACYKKMQENKCAYCRGSVDNVVVLCIPS